MTTYLVKMLRGVLLILGVAFLSYSVSTPGVQVVYSVFSGIALMLSVTLQMLEESR